MPALHFGGRKKDLQDRLYPNGVDQLIIRQGQLPDCQLLTVLYALSTIPQGQAILKRMISLTPDGDFVVRFKKYPGRPITVSRQEVYRKPRNKFSQRAKQADADLGIRILEVAYPRLMKEVSPSAYANIPHDRILSLYEHNCYHQNPIRVLDDITGWNVEYLTFRKNSHHEATYREAMEQQLSALAENPQSRLLLAASNVTEKQPNYIKRLHDAYAKVADPRELALLEKVIAKTFNDDELADWNYSVDPGRKLPGYHLLTVAAADRNKRTVELRDPHNTAIGLILSYEDFFKQFRGIVVANVPAVKTMTPFGFRNLPNPETAPMNVDP